MDLKFVQELSADELADHLGNLGISQSWIIHAQIIDSARAMPTEPCLPPPSRSQKQGFQNLIVGTIAEHVFRDEHLSDLEANGFEIIDYHEAGENRDYGLQRDGEELPINVKTASTLFRKAKSVVGLDPEDCIPISAYKALSASERVPDLIYVDLVDFTMREKVDHFMNGLDGPFGVGWHLLSWYSGKGVRSAEDRYINALFDQHGEALKKLAPSVTQFRVISAKKVLAILRHIPRRVPGLGVRGAGTGGFNAEVNVHVSVAKEMVPWTDVAKELRKSGIPVVLDRIRRTQDETWPDPTL